MICTCASSFLWCLGLCDAFFSLLIGYNRSPHIRTAAGLGLPRCDPEPPPAGDGALLRVLVRDGLCRGAPTVPRRLLASLTRLVVHVDWHCVCLHPSVPFLLPSLRGSFRVAPSITIFPYPADLLSYCLVRRSPLYRHAARTGAPATQLTERWFSRLKQGPLAPWAVPGRLVRGDQQ